MLPRGSKLSNDSTGIDYGTFRTPPLMSKRTIRIPDEGWDAWGGAVDTVYRRGDDVRRTARLAVELKLM